MMISKSDFPLIRREAFIFLVLLCVGIVAIVAGGVFVAQARLDSLDARRTMNEARNRLDQKTKEMRDWKSYSAEYNELLMRNIIGNERRTNWTEGLEKIRSKNQVIDFRYTISVQQPYSPPFPLDSGNFALHLSRMSIRLDLLHEEQLLVFLEALRTEINGWFILDHCSIERSRIALTKAHDSDAPATSDNRAMQRILPNLRAECTGGWLTMQSRHAP